MTRTSKYLNQDTIAALQAFQIEKIVKQQLCLGLNILKFLS